MYTTKISNSKNHILLVSEYVSPDPNWKEKASCKNSDVSTFFPNTSSPSKLQLNKAFALCKRCPVAAYCMHEALLCYNNGIWAHSTEFQRKYYLKYIIKNGATDVTLEDAANFYKDLSDSEFYSTRKLQKVLSTEN
jgi:WhiB family redox-sensing transcriptional regulator